MPNEYKKVDFQEFINKYGIDMVINNAPKVLYPKKDREHEAFSSLIAFLLLTGILLIYISFSIIFMENWFSLTLFLIIVISISVLDILLILNYIRSSIFIKPIECWVEIYRGKNQNNSNYYCFSYYPIFSGKCHPNRAKDIIYKLYREQILEDTTDITQIEVYLKLNNDNVNYIEHLGFFFQYGEGKSFINPDIDRNQWKYFPFEKQGIENFVAVANWDHQFEWRNDLELDFDKLHEYAPWIIKSWNKSNIKPLTDKYKEKIRWEKRYIEEKPKLNPWENEIENQTYTNENAHQDIVIINQAIEKILGEEPILNNIRDIKDYIPEFKAFFRDLN